MDDYFDVLDHYRYGIDLKANSGDYSISRYTFLQRKLDEWENEYVRKLEEDDK